MCRKGSFCVNTGLFSCSEILNETRELAVDKVNSGLDALTIGPGL